MFCYHNKMKLLFLCLALIMASNGANAADKDAKIIVVGSGVSAIAATTKLLENGFKNIQILEAENRIGGRLYTVPFGSSVVDLGAQWVHGENTAFKLANPFGLLSSATTRPETVTFIRSNREVVSPTVISTLTEFALNSKNAEAPNNPPGTEDDYYGAMLGSFGRYVDKRIDEALESDLLSGITPEIIPQFFNFYMKTMAAFEAADSYYDVSSNSAFQDSPGDQFLNWKDKGYKTMIDILTKKYPDPTKDLGIEKLVALNKTVSNIDWNNNPVTVTCVDGSTYTADHVISTVSIGVMKEKHQTMFTPRLAPAKRNAIENINLGTANKIYIEFEKPFWKKDYKGMNLLWNAKDLKEAHKAQDTWIEGIIGIFTVDFQPNLMQAFVIGKEARRMETMSEDDVKKAIMYVIRKFLKDVPDPVRILRTQWHSNPNFRGSWSYDTVHTVPGDRATLAEPLLEKSGKPSVLFAGEATSNHHFKSVHGAIETGWREADRLIEFYK